MGIENKLIIELDCLVIVYMIVIRIPNFMVVFLLYEHGPFS